MVNRKILSQYTNAPPIDGDQRKISGGPLYAEEQIISAVQAIPRTRKCKNDIANLLFDCDDLLNLVKEAVSLGRYKDSEWCTDKPNGNLFACDSYVYKKSRWSEYQFKNVIDEYFVKFCIGKSGSILLTISCHLSS